MLIVFEFQISTVKNINDLIEIRFSSICIDDTLLLWIGKKAIDQLVVCVFRLQRIEMLILVCFAVGFIDSERIDFSSTYFRQDAYSNANEIEIKELLLARFSRWFRLLLNFHTWTWNDWIFKSIAYICMKHGNQGKQGTTSRTKLQFFFYQRSMLLQRYVNGWLYLNLTAFFVRKIIYGFLFTTRKNRFIKPHFCELCRTIVVRTSSGKF